MNLNKSYCHLHHKKKSVSVSFIINVVFIIDNYYKKIIANISKYT